MCCKPGGREENSKEEGGEEEIKRFKLPQFLRSHLGRLCEGQPLKVFKSLLLFILNDDIPNGMGARGKRLMTHFVIKN